MSARNKSRTRLQPVSRHSRKRGALSFAPRMLSGGQACGLGLLLLVNAACESDVNQAQPAEQRGKVAGSPASVAAFERAKDQPLPDRDPVLAKKLVDQHGALLIDVRRQDEWEAGHLPGAHHLPLGKLEERLDELGHLTQGDKAKPLVLYCRSGRRSGLAKQVLLAAGYQRVTNLGGMDDWPEG